ncbi:hypothetical protein [Paenibacillus sp. NPDC058174]|uniref:hypothetical protein n=1 Tax=Paenibacillus sp. NPDC058174 TaxID=3346366 RepID=UPI0036DBD089
MSTTTKKYNLAKPGTSDHIHQTILDLANNFQIIDDALETTVSSTPTSGAWKINQRVYYTNTFVGGFVGAINIRAGEAAPVWDSLTAYTTGQKITPTANNGHYYTCIQAGHSSPYEPAWLVASGTITEDTKNKSYWEPTKAYELYDIVIPSVPNDRFYVCTVAGTSGTNEPDWAAQDGIATSDRGVVWMSYRIVKWKESGPSVNFRPFGKIE